MEKKNYLSFIKKFYLKKMVTLTLMTNQVKEKRKKRSWDGQHFELSSCPWLLFWLFWMLKVLLVGLKKREEKKCWFSFFLLLLLLLLLLLCWLYLGVMGWWHVEELKYLVCLAPVKTDVFNRRFQTISIVWNGLKRARNSVTDTWLSSTPKPTESTSRNDCNQTKSMSNFSA